MNWRIECESANVSNADIEVQLSESEEGKKPKPKPDEKIVNIVRKAAKDIAAELGAKDVHVEANVHETTEGRGFRPGHVSIVVSKLDPKR